MLTLLLLPTALAAPPGLTLLPFGVGVYAHGKPARGVVYSVTQAAGIGVLSWATAEAYSAAEVEDDETFYRYQSISIGAVTLAAGSYLVSVIDGSRLHELEGEAEAARGRVDAWDTARATQSHRSWATLPARFDVPALVARQEVR